MANRDPQKFYLVKGDLLNTLENRRYVGGGGVMVSTKPNGDVVIEANVERYWVAINGALAEREFCVTPIPPA